MEDLRIHGALVLVQLLFAVNYLVCKAVLGAWPPLVWAVLRNGATAVILAGAALLLRVPHPPFDRRFFLPVLGLALLGVTLNQAFFLTGLALTSPLNAALLCTLIPVYTLGFSAAAGRERLGGKRGAAILVAFAGALVVCHVERLSFSHRPALGNLLIILNTLSYAAYLSWGKQFVERHHGLWVTVWLFVFGTLGIVPLSAFEWGGFERPAMTPGLFAAMAYVVVGATVLTYFLNNWALARTHASQVALLIYLQPVLTALIAWGWYGEVPTGRTCLAAALIFGGIFFAGGGAYRALAEPPGAALPEAQS